MPPKRKEKIPPPGNKKDEFTNFMTKAKWKGALSKSSLEVAGRNMRPQGAVILGNALLKNKWVTMLDLSHNAIGDHGATDLAQVLKVNDMLQDVRLACNGITCIGAVAIASAFVPYSNATGQPSQWNRCVSSLSLSGNAIRDDGFVALANAAACHRDLTAIDLTNNQITGFAIKALARSMERNHLCNFMLAHNRLGDDGAAALCHAWQRYGGKGPQGVLALADNDVSLRGAEAIGAMLAQNDFVNDLFLAHNTVGGKGMEAIAGRMIEPCRNVVRVINLNNNCLQDDGAVQLARVIEASPPALVRVIASHNDITDKGGVALGRALEANTGLQVLNVAFNQFGEPAVSAFKDALQATKTLTLLDIKGCGLTEQQKTGMSGACGTATRCDHGNSDDDMRNFLEKIAAFVDQQRQEEEARARKPKKGKGKKAKA